MLYEIHYYDESREIALDNYEPAEGMTMLAPDEKLKLSPKPYLSATPRFASGADTPRDFLERCLADLAALEPKIGAFVHLNLDGARAAADRADRTLARGPAAVADRRHAGRHQGHHRDRRHADREGLAAVRGLPLRARCRQRRRAARSRRGDRGQDRDHRIRRHASRAAPATRTICAARPAGRAAARPRASPPA